MEQFIDIIIKLLAAVLAYAGICLAKRASDFFKSKMSAEDAAKLDQFIGELTEAADQMLKRDDPDGTKRYAYVVDMLIEAGYEITDIIRAKIESAVFRLPHDIESAQIINLGGEQK